MCQSGPPFHPRTLPLCESLNYREWAGYYAVSAYEAHHEHEYNAIRNAAALIDVSPLYKYLVSGPDAVRLVDRVITRDATKVGVGQVIYTPWCDERGKTIDDGTVTQARRNDVAVDGGGSEPPMAAAERGRAERHRRRHQRAAGRAGAPGPHIGRVAARGG